MDALDNYRRVIEAILTGYEQIPYAYGDFCSEVVFDRAHDRYLLVNVGWDNDRRVHGVLVHINIIDGKVWVQRDGTEQGIANELVAAGVPQQQIVLGFRRAEIRQHIEYAVA